MLNADTSQVRQALILANTDNTVEVITDITSATGFHGYANNGDAFEVKDYHLVAANQKIGVPGSPALDVGDNSVVAAGAQDLDRAPRIRGNVVDLGAYEAQAVLAITRQPIGATRHRTADYTFWISVAHGTNPIAYAWRKNGSALSGATASALALTNLSLSNAGAYSCRVTDAGGGNVVSNNADLAVLNGLPIEILTQPASDAKYLDEFHTFSIIATNGVPPLSYQWSHNWAYVPGATASGLTRGPLVLSDAGTYGCWVYDVTAADLAGARRRRPAGAPRCVM